MKSAYPLVVIVGRTNVGKSTLFNRLSQERVAIVDSSPGVTRDFLENFVTIGTKTVRIVDTGGLEIFVSSGDAIQKEIETKAWSLLKEAHLVLFVVDGRSPLTQIEWELSSRLRKENLPTVLVVNKREGMIQESLPEEFLRLGIEKMVQISAHHGDGVGTLKKLIEHELQHYEAEKSNPAHNAIHIAIVGKPNVGKSTLFNTILGDERAIVSDVPGTTRDALRSIVDTEYGKYAFLDTAGLTRRSRTEEGVEFYAYLRAKESIEKSQVCIFVLDPFQGITRQDQKIAQEIAEKKKCCLVLLNKIDLLPENSPAILKKLLQEVRLELNFLGYAVFLAGSAKENKLRYRILSTIAGIFTRYHQVVHPDMLNQKIRQKVNMHFQRVFSDAAPFIYRITQERIAPPVFMAYTDYRGYKDIRRREYHARVLEKVLRGEMDWEGVPIEIGFERAKSRSVKNLS
ncbi:MAG: ribosome biogenesis GTPase Der [Atribacterota bacterium]|nr:ribosome biogenesis GTPase Der [Atribacterota bacterium]